MMIAAGAEIGEIAVDVRVSAEIVAVVAVRAAGIRARATTRSRPRRACLAPAAVRAAARAPRVVLVPVATPVAVHALVPQVPVPART